ncbi:MAG: hypothetical protein N3E51_02565 [Candidatus Micrarchaeota archaeon]|nr:hypothetical protein [Candidatus Micrarchaeota archaeon]
MPLPKNRSSSVRKIAVRTPKGGHAMHYKRRRKGKKHSCAVCKARLPGVADRKAPNRRFGGRLCTSCSSRAIIIAQRIKEGGMKLSEVDILLLPYVKSLKLN